MPNGSVNELADSWVETRLPSGRTVLIRGFGPSSWSDDAGEVTDVKFRTVDFKALTSTLHELGDLISNAVRPLAPREVEVELGLGVNASTGQVLLVFGEASAEASIKVNLRWEFGAEQGNAEQA